MEAAQQKSLSYLDTSEAAAFLRLRPSTLEKRRVTGGGPVFHKFGRRVVYALADLESWAAGRAYGSTSEFDMPRRG